MPARSATELVLGTTLGVLIAMLGAESIDGRPRLPAPIASLAGWSAPAAPCPDPAAAEAVVSTLERVAGASDGVDLVVDCDVSPCVAALWGGEPGARARVLGALREAGYPRARALSVVGGDEAVLLVVVPMGAGDGHRVQDVPPSSGPRRAGGP